MAEWRHAIHANPETAFEEHRTSEMVAGLLASWGLEVRTGLAGTGVVASLRGRYPGNRAVALRADMDALPIEEQGTPAYRSTRQGHMHACGHDGHTAMLLGAAKSLAADPSFAGTVHFVFQPAEENEGGGRVMVEQGLFREFPVEAVFGMHNWPGLPAGTIALQPGPMMAAFDIFEIVLEGKGAHAAMPHLGRDVIVGAAQLVGALQTIPSRNIHPCDAGVISVTQLHAGDTWNVLPASAVLRGTVRAFSAAVQDTLESRLKETAAGIAATFGLTVRVRYERRYPATLNSPAETALAAKAAEAVVGAAQVVHDPQPSMGAEDFAFLLAERPGCYVWLGAGENVPGLHHPQYDFNDALLGVGASYWVSLVETALPAGA
jgi:hippurate hydrolase